MILRPESLVSRVLHQILYPDLQRIGDRLQRSQGQVHLASFDCPDLCPVNAADVGEDILAPFLLQSQFTDLGSHCSLHILH